MPDHQQILELFFIAVDDLNRQLPEDKRLDKSADTVLHGQDARLDSLAFVNLVLGIETKVNEALGRPINLAENLIDHQDDQLPRNFTELADRVLKLCEESNG